jgi:adenylyl-sulfate kinase
METAYGCGARHYSTRKGEAMERNGFTVWFTGLPSSGKSTLAGMLQKKLLEFGFPVEILDGDEVRQRLNQGLGFSKEDREENIRRISYVAKLLARVGAVAITAAISPYRSSRDQARSEIENFVEVYINCPVEECIRRDVKGLYAKALQGKVQNFTGVSDPYEPPSRPEITVFTDRESPEESLQKILHGLVALEYIPRAAVGMNGDELGQTEGTILKKRL